MPTSKTSSLQSFDERVFELLDGSWRAVGEVRRLLGRGEALSVAMALDRLWEAGRIDKDTAHVVVGAARKGGGGELGFLKFRRKQDGTVSSTPQ
jgi:hypothetical protein